MSVPMKSRQMAIRFDPALVAIIEETARRHMQTNADIVRAAVHLLGKLSIEKRRDVLEEYLYPKRKA